MNIARHIALIDELCFRPFPAEHGPSDVGDGGPGYHVVVLERSEDDCGTRAATVEQFEKYRDALYEVYAPQWRHTHPLNLQTTLLRTEREEMPEPWRSLSAGAAVAHLWEAQRTGRWIAVAVADRDPAADVQLLAVVTDVAPP
ncbi:hypothetical protein WKI71_07130 [Streptomyces sp. MS1.AVA.1]|uniref:Uncharacterized protein n=1 Tax=Streptomyces machairae TaxID=3134109 RepID=A0ABU8UHL4_9ACTN